MNLIVTHFYDALKTLKERQIMAHVHVCRLLLYL